MAAHQNLIKNKFEKCYLEFAERGILSDEFQEQIEVPADVNYAGDNIHRYSLCESYQRSKSLSNVWQCEQKLEVNNLVA